MYFMKFSAIHYIHTVCRACVRSILNKMRPRPSFLILPVNPVLNCSIFNINSISNDSFRIFRFLRYFVKTTHTSTFPRPGNNKLCISWNLALCSIYIRYVERVPDRYSTRWGLYHHFSSCRWIQYLIFLCLTSIPYQMIVFGFFDFR